MGGGYGAGSAPEYDWTYSTLWVPTSKSKAESVLMYRVSSRLRVGVSHLWEQNTLRWQASFNASPETEKAPAINFSAGVQGIGTGHRGFSATAEKNFGPFNVYAGIGYRSKESHTHLLAGFKYRCEGNLSVGLQNDGHNSHFFVVKNDGPVMYGAYLVELDRPALMIGYRFYDCLLFIVIQDGPLSPSLGRGDLTIQPSTPIHVELSLWLTS